MNILSNVLKEVGQQSEQDRLEKFRTNWEIYYGQGDKPLKLVPGSTFDDNIRMNYARLFVDKGVAFLFGKDVGFELEEGKVTPAEAYLERIWQSNSKMSKLQRLATNGGVCGTAFLRILIVPGQDPRLIVLDPETVTVTLAEDDFEDVTEYKIQYTSKDEKGDPVGVRHVISRNGNQWIINDERGAHAGSHWETIKTTAWAYPFSPIIHCQNMIAPNEFWGMSDLENDLIEVINKKNFVMANTLKIIRHHAHPKTIAEGLPATEIAIKAGVDDLIVLEKEGATMHNLEMQSDLSSSLAVGQELTEFIHELARVPQVSTGKVESIGQLSGVALEILYQPLLEKTEAKRVTYGELMIETNRRLLAIGGFGDNNYTTLRWQGLLPKDNQVMANAALIKNRIGVSKDTLVQELGYDADQERKKRSQETTLASELIAAFDRDGADLEE